MGIGVTYLDQWVSAKAIAGQTPAFILAPKSFLYKLSLYLGWLLFWGGLVGIGMLLIALVYPAPFIQLATEIFSRSGLAQNAFADGRQFFGYQWPNFFKFFMMVMASGAVLRITRCPIFMPFPPFKTKIPAWQPMLILIIAVALLLAGAGFNPSVKANLLTFEPKAITWLKAQQQQDPYFRITSLDTPDGPGNKVFLANSGMPHKLFDVRGYDSIIPGQYAKFMHLIQENGDLLFNRVGPLYTVDYTALDSALLNLLGVRYLLTTVEIDHPSYQQVYNDEILIYENLDTLPRAFMVSEAVTPANFEKPAELAAMDDEEFALRSLNPRQQLILDGETNQRGRDLTTADVSTPASTNQVTITDYGPTDVYLTVETQQPDWLVLTDAYFTGWKAYATPAHLQSPEATEIELTIHRGNGNFRAVQLQPGQWQIRFRYSPRSFQLGLYVSFLSFAILVLMAGYWVWGKLYQESEEDSAIKRIAKNSLVPMIMALSNRVVDFAFALLMLRILQPEGAGRYAFAVAFIGMAEIIIRFGLGTLVTRDVAGDPTEPQSNRYLSNVSVLRIYMWLAALPFMGAILALYVFFGGTTLEVVLTVGIFALGTFFSNLSDGLTALFYAHEKAEYPAGVTAITTLTRVSLGAMVLLLGWGIIGLAFASLMANLVAFVLLYRILIDKIIRPQFTVDNGLQKEMLHQGFPLMINHLLSTIFFRIDVFILKPVQGSTAVGYYSAAYKYVDGINVIPQYFTLAVFPLMSRLATNSRESLVRAYILSLRLLLMLALPIAMGTPFVAEELIWFLAGPAFLPDSALVLQLLIWFLPFSFINQVTQYVLIAINQQRQLTKAFVIGVVFNTVTNLIFIPLYGYKAAAVTTIASEWALLIPFYLLVRKHLCTVPWFDVVWRPTLAAAVMGLTLWFSGDINFLITLTVGSVVYLITLVMVGGLQQHDMSVVWRALPLQRFKQGG